jgi:hypothetical protein
LLCGSSWEATARTHARSGSDLDQSSTSTGMENSQIVDIFERMRLRAKEIEEL